MKTLKFRAWTHQNPPMQWFSKNVAITGDGKQMTPIGGTSTGIWQTFGDDDEDLVIEQFTGLLDRNGKEIYEGDIVRYGNSVAVIIWREENAEFGVRWIDCGVEDSISWQIVVEKTSSEVIGNIHENPELLEEKE